LFPHGIMASSQHGGNTCACCDGGQIRNQGVEPQPRNYL